MQNITAVIALGGHGSRLKSITGDVPKPLFPILGESTLFRCISELNRNGIRSIILTLSYKYEDFTAFLVSCRKHFDFDIQVHLEDEPLGECGALWKISSLLSDTFLFVNGDLVFSMDLSRFYNFHCSSNSDLTLVTHVSDHPHDSDLLNAPNGYNIKHVFPKNQPNHTSSSAYLGNAGIAFLKKRVVSDLIPPSSPSNSSLFHHIVPLCLEMPGYQAFSYNTSEYIKDMGTPDRFYQVESDLRASRLATKSYSTKQSVLFLDRDNTLISCPDHEYILDHKSLVYLDQYIQKLALLSKSFDFVCLVTNQPQISMGLLSIDLLDLIHGELVRFCLTYNLKIDVISFCPHHPHSGFEEEIIQLKIPCFCRKPNPGLLVEQAYFRNIDMSSSLFVGDSASDSIAASRAGCNFKYVSEI